eukprot:2767724-Rhodomonas_salina.5
MEHREDRRYKALSAYAPATRCPVLRQPYALAMPSPVPTHTSSYQPRRCPVLTYLISLRGRYAPIQHTALCDVRY